MGKVKQSTQNTSLLPTPPPHTNPPQHLSSISLPLLPSTTNPLPYTNLPLLLTTPLPSTTSLLLTTLPPSTTQLLLPLPTNPVPNIPSRLLPQRLPLPKRLRPLPLMLPLPPQRNKLFQLKT